MTSIRHKSAKFVTAAVALGGIVTAPLGLGLAHGAVNIPEPTAQVSFTFDDGPLNSLTEAAPTLQKHGLTGTNYVITDCVGMTSVPNDCRANGNRVYMTWDQIAQLQSQYGWEIGSHGTDHQCLASSGHGCQPEKLTAEQVEAQMAESRSALAAHGITATAFAPPYGDYDHTVMAKAATYYSSMRGFRDENVNHWPFSDYLLNNVGVQEGRTTVATLKAKVDEAIENKTWTVFTFHDIVPEPSGNPYDYQFATAELDELAAYVKTKVDAGLIKNVNVSDGLVTGTANKLPGASFTAGLSEGWSTDSDRTITADGGGNGSYPDPRHSVKLVSGTAPSHLFSPRVPVSPETNYLFKSFLNVSKLESGEVAFYVDEYNSVGDWISGQYLKAETSRWVQELNFPYTPSSQDVATTSLQVIVEGTGITAYLDNVELLALGNEVLPPPPTNLMTNGTFDAGISEGWDTDSPEAFLADSADNGAPSNPENSVKVQATADSAHLRSPQVDVSQGDYTLAAYLNITRRTAGEVGFYIDEYDAEGTWVSGQWKRASTELGASRIDLRYSPSSPTVAMASLQVYATGGSDIVAYLDDVGWWRS